jgi:hypothetical protein
MNDSLTTASPLPGRARIVPDDPVEAGSLGRFTVEYRVARGGIAVGGGIQVGIHWGCGWRRLQIDDPSNPGYVEASIAVPNAPGTSPAEASGKMLGQPAGSPVTFDTEYQLGPPFLADFYHTRVTVRLRQPLPEDAVIRVTYGAGPEMVRVQSFEDPRMRFKVYVDAVGTGEFREIDQHPVLRIVAAHASRIEAVIPSTVVVGESVRVGIRVKDRYNNLAASYRGSVGIVSDTKVKGLPDLVAFGEGDGGIIIISDVRFLEPGVARISLKGDGGLAGTSNPVWVFPEEPERRIYWAELHGHTEEISDGRGTVDEYFTFGRDKALLDVCAQGDHLDGRSFAEWEIMRRKADEYYDPDRYVTLLGYEYSNPYGDKNVYFRTSDVDLVPVSSPAEFEEAYENVPGLLIPHMTGYPVGQRGNDWNLHDPEVERLVEVYSCHGNSEALGRPRPLGRMAFEGTVEAALRRGYKLGFIGGSDEHDGHPGDTPIDGGCLKCQGGLAAIMACELTRETVFDALWDRMCYATTTARILLDFRIDGVPNGREYRLPVGSRKIRLTARVSAVGPIESIEVIKNSDVFARYEEHSMDVELELEDEPAGPVDYYYVRLVQKDTEMAWSSPIWVLR